MQVQSTNNHTPSFGALNIESKVKTLIESERDGKATIKRAIKELENSLWETISINYKCLS